eukprot:CAMPEP_0198307560 /NCGR_PEP_ID=MMETSP1450-20131203/412_1 /TAXON_ID=753684 ORGANISM="Madagascaria erythrocladiodes, Strain CCMP3234" /NCGR_SAMPLE_ID=MMETSP1450 /ASSEMBLY_ACC=CAM_ASM_001115 /LENGTH=492 /DNA_ID=CAMNT_0044010145 /DNA_START=46 /DNA_END=1522 /DNA_ORIENTATION=+
MKLNVACPFTGMQKVIVVEDAKTLSQIYEKRIAQEIAGEVLGEQYAGYVFRITGGNDKQGFPMKQGVLTQSRVRLLMKGGTTCYHPKRNGERKRKSVRGCIVGPDIAVLNMIIAKKGAGELEGLTDKVLPRRLGPKRATKIRALFLLDKKDDVRKYVITRQPEKKEGQEKQPRAKRPKIQRLVTPKRVARKRHELQHKRQRVAKAKADAAEYHALLKRRLAEQRAKRHTHLSQKRQERLSAVKESGGDGAAAASAKKADGGAKKKAAAADAKKDDKKGSSGAAAAAAAAAATDSGAKAPKKESKKAPKKAKDSKKAPKKAKKYRARGTHVPVTTKKKDSIPTAGLLRTRASFSRATVGGGVEREQRVVRAAPLPAVPLVQQPVPPQREPAHGAHVDGVHRAVVRGARHALVVGECTRERHAVRHAQRRHELARAVDARLAVHVDERVAGAHVAHDARHAPRQLVGLPRGHRAHQVLVQHAVGARRRARLHAL